MLIFLACCELLQASYFVLTLLLYNVNFFNHYAERHLENHLQENQSKQNGGWLEVKSITDS